jgi:hypothetical protein
MNTLGVWFLDGFLGYCSFNSNGPKLRELGWEAGRWIWSYKNPINSSIDSPHILCHTTRITTTGSGMADTEELTQGDKSFWLPEGEPIITPERAAKGDVFTGPDCGDCHGSGKDPITKLSCKTCRGKGWVGSINAASLDSGDIRFAQVREINLLSLLRDHNHISDQQHHDGQTFQVWRDMHRAQLGTEKPVSSGGDEPFGVRLRAYGFILLLQRLNRLDYSTIEATLTPMAMSWVDWIARNRVERYVTALERLSRLLPPIKDRIAHLESLTDEQRAEISKESIKKMLEVIKAR